MSSDFDTYFQKSFISYLKTKNEEDITRIMTSIAFDLTTSKKGEVKAEATKTDEIKAESTEIELHTGRKLSAYIQFGNEIHKLLKKKFPDFTPQQIMTEKSRLWQLKKKDPSLTNEQLIGIVPEEVIAETTITVLPTVMKVIRQVKRKIPKHVRTQVWNEWIGPDLTRYKCTCCNKSIIDINTFECGHVVAESNGGDETIKNLRPICGGCNRGMGTMDMREFARKHFGRDLGF